ncbi:hypothetical protein Golomagni_01100 [Golovinomyces magnicellulatus]|nr:hypothetical protein Golomagni_01100 [Golovinomyces magnicellulatus]
MNCLGANIRLRGVVLPMSITPRSSLCQSLTNPRRHYSKSQISSVRVKRAWSRQLPSLTICNTSIRHASSSVPPDSPRKTPLYDLHIAHKGLMVKFGGYMLPIQYSNHSITESHLFTRENASLFDVSHMVQHTLSGPGAVAFLERITPSDFTGLPIRSSKLSVLLWPKTGGIVDDTMITRLGPQSFYLVTNAGCREKDINYLCNQLEEFEKSNGEKVKWDILEDHGLIALQGPLSEEIISNVLVEAEVKDLKKMYFSQSQYIKIKLSDESKSAALLITRGGYTGEDGFEISIPHNEMVQVTERLLQSASHKKLRFAGLAARDSLRLEAGMCLYGHDLNDSITPVEAGLSWVIGKNRRIDGNFNGAEVIIPQLTPANKGGKGVLKRRVGLIVEGAPAREGTNIVDAEGSQIGVVTSGCPSPSLGKNISMGYIKDGFHRPGTKINVVVRGKGRKAEVTKMPFVPAKYWKEATPA